MLLARYEVCCGLFHGFDWSAWTRAARQPSASPFLPAAQEHILAQDGGKDRFLQAVTELSKAFALAVPHEEAIRIRDDVGFFQAVRAAIAKTSAGDRKASGDLDHAIRQIVSKAIASDQVIDIFAAAGLKNPDISILSDQFLADVRGMQHKNLAVELLRKLLNDEVKARSKHNLVQARSFAELLEKSVRRYQNRAVEAAQVIQELIDLAKDMRAAQKRGDKLGLTSDELAFYDALEVNDSAVKVLGDDTLRTIARELVDTVRKNVTIDWTVKESVRARSASSSSASSGSTAIPPTSRSPRRTPCSRRPSSSPTSGPTSHRPRRTDPFPQSIRPHADASSRAPSGAGRQPARAGAAPACRTIAATLRTGVSASRRAALPLFTTIVTGDRIIGVAAEGGIRAD
jgi:hypothetical protein